MSDMDPQDRATQSPPPPPRTGGADGVSSGGPNGTFDGGNRGLFGCLGCAGAVVFLLIAIPIVLIGGTWLMLPRIVAPADTEWVMVAPDPERGAEVRENLESELADLGPGERATLELTEADLNLLLANALAEQRRGSGSTGPPPQARFRIGDGLVHLDAMVVIPEEATGVPRRLRGQPAGIELALVPRAAGDMIAMRIRDVRMGRVPLPVEFAMDLLAGSEAAEDMPFLDPDTGEIRFSIQQLGGATREMTLHDLRVGDGVLRLELSR